MAEDIYTAAGREYLCRNGYLHGCRESAETLFTRQPCVHIKYLFTRQPLKCKIGCIHGCRICFQKWLFARQPFKSNFGNIQRIYTRLQAGSAYVEMVIYTAAGNQQKTLFTRQPCVHIKYLFTRQPLKCQIGCIHGCRICFQKWLFARQPFKSNFGNIQRIYTRLQAGSAYVKMVIYTARRESAENVIYTAAVCPHKIFIYTAAVKVPNWLYTRLPYMFSKMVICTAAIQEQFRQYTCLRGFILRIAGSTYVKMVIYTAAIKESNWLFSRLPGVSKNRYLHGSRVSTLIIYLKGSHSSAKSAAYTAVVYAFKKRLS